MAVDPSKQCQLIIVTPEAEVFDASIRGAILPAHDGQYGVLGNHAPFLIKLGAGPLEIDDADGGKQTYYVEGGVAQMKDNKLTVLTDDALTPDKIDKAKTTADLEAAIAVEAHSDAEQELKAERMQRARAKLALVGV
ncbi:MAG: ATP synthase F1 subunit epsilon [Planctomycetota bacterium]